MESVFDNVHIDIHNDDTKQPPFDTFQLGEKFGVLNIKMTRVEITKQPLFLLFTVDKTGSMGEKTNDGSTKLDHVIQTFKSMMNYLAKQDAIIYVCIQTFNDTVDVTIPTVKLSDKGVLSEIMKKINDIDADGNTNIENALKYADKTLVSYATQNPTHQLGHIFMTDGEATDGLKHPGELKALVNDKFHNIFVGFGQYHNANLLRILSNTLLGEYQFVDNMENTKMVYGETIHKFLYPAIHNVEIVVENGIIYDWKTNTWVDTIYEPILVGEAVKNYHIRMEKQADIQATIYTTMTEERVCVKSVSYIENPNEKTDLTKYMYRQKVQELLHTAKMRGNKRNLKTDLRKTFEKMHRYMRENDCMEDAFMKQLCEDVYIVYTTMDMENGMMYSLSRQSTQGRQQTYNVSTPVVNNNRQNYAVISPRRPRMTRQRTLFRRQIFDSQMDSDNDNDNDNDTLMTESDNDTEIGTFCDPCDDIDNYKPTACSDTSCYMSPLVMTLVNSMTQEL
jgi:hypothetical protein